MCQPLPQAKVSGFEAYATCSRAQRGQAVSGPDSRSCPMGFALPAVLAAAPCALRTIGGVSECDRSQVSSLSELRSLEVICSARDDAQEASCVRGSSIGAAHKCNNVPGGLQVAGGSLSEHIDQPIGTPVNGGKPGAVAVLGFTNGSVRIVRGLSARPSPTAWAIMFQTLARGLVW